MDKIRRIPINGKIDPLNIASNPSNITFKIEMGTSSNFNDLLDIIKQRLPDMTIDNLEDRRILADVESDLKDGMNRNAYLKVYDFSKHYLSKFQRMKNGIDLLEELEKEFETDRKILEAYPCLNVADLTGLTSEKKAETETSTALMKEIEDMINKKYVDSSLENELIKFLNEFREFVAYMPFLSHYCGSLSDERTANYISNFLTKNGMRAKVANSHKGSIVVVNY